MKRSAFVFGIFMTVILASCSRESGTNQVSMVLPPDPTVEPTVEPTIEPTVEPTVPPSPVVSLKSISSAGSGCFPGSVGLDWDAMDGSFLLTFDAFEASVGASSGQRLDRKNCAVTLDFYYPVGYTIGIAELVSSGTVNLEPKLTAEQKTTVWFAGMSQQVKLANKFGPKAENISGPYRFVQSGATMPWSPCGESRALVINSEVIVENSKNRSGAGSITLGGAETPLKLRLKMQRCN